jgi:hypothetical protein
VAGDAGNLVYHFSDNFLIHGRDEKIARKRLIDLTFVTDPERPAVLNIYHLFIRGKLVLKGSAERSLFQGHAKPALR